MPQATGYVAAVQEDRFRLLTDEGQALLLVLSNHASSNGDDLCHWHEANTHVTVEYEGPPNTVDGVARSVFPSPAPNDSRQRAPDASQHTGAH